MNTWEMLNIVNAITYKPGWTVRLCEEKRSGKQYVQLEVSEEAEVSLDSTKRDGTRTHWRSAKRYLSPHMCGQEVVGVVFGLIKDAELHEVHEWFRFRGASIYNPHLDPEVLVEVARKKSSFVTRQNAMSMEEKSIVDLDGNTGWVIP